MPRRKAAAYGRGRVTYNAARSRWEATVYIKGRRVYRTAPTEPEAWKLLDELNTMKRSGASPKPQTLRQYLEAWVARRGRGVGGLKPSTLHDYRSKLRLYVYPKLGDKRLDRVTAIDLEDLFTGIGKAARTVRTTRAIVHAALQEAWRLGVLVENPAARTRAPKLRDPDTRVFSQAEAERFIEAIAGDPWEDYYLLAMMCGPRQGELRALRWRDVGDDEIRIAGSLQRVGGLDHRGEPKSGKPRAIPVPKRVMALLRQRRAAQAEEYLRLGVRPPHDLVFTRNDGQPVHGSTMTKRFQKVCVGAGLPSIKFHALRHYATSWLQAQGFTLREVQDILGHATPSFTLRVYTHSVPEDVRRKMEGIG